MKITVNNTRFDINADDLKSVDVEFSFWQGRRIKLCGNDAKKHFLRYNDIVKGILAEDATFIEGEDKQKIYTALNILKHKGYPYEGSWEIKAMLFLKQMFGNIFRQGLLDQLETTLNVEIEELSDNEELFTSEEINSKVLSTIYNEKYVDLFPLIFKYAGRTACFPLMFTCKLFHEIITADKHKNYLRDLDLLKQIFRDCQDTKWDMDTRAPKYRPAIQTTDIIEIESKCLLLLAEFFPKEVIRITPPNKIYTQNNNYIKHLQKLATVLAKIDPKSALKVVSSMDAECYPVQTFCAVAAIHKHSTLCDEKQVLAMGDMAYSDPTLISNTKGLFSNITGSRSLKYSISDLKNCENLMELFEASLGIHSPLTNETLKLMGEYPTSDNNSGVFIQTLAKMVKRIGVDQLTESEFWEMIVDLLCKPLEIQFNDYHPNGEFNMAQSLAILAQTLVLFDEEKSIQVLDLALTSVNELVQEEKVRALMEIAEAFADIDQDRALKVAMLTLTEAECLFAWTQEETEGLYSLGGYKGVFDDYRLDLFEVLSRIIKIIAMSNREHAIQVLGEITEKIRTLDEDVHQLDENTFSIAQFPQVPFMGAIEVYTPFDHKRAALEVAYLGVEWAKTRENKSTQDDNTLLKLSQILLKRFPDQAFEVAILIKRPEKKCQALLSILRQGCY
ncbi:MAG: hypothetical protein H0T62_07945 [Parachlamydiaceae bacterium]|nr:hypothetical protein [Parachlamydiaceae bacterium]